MQEKQIETKSAKWAKDNGWYTRKFSSPSHRGVPDRIFLKNGVVVFIEFKTEKGVVSVLQQKELNEITQLGGNAHVCRSVEECKKILIQSEKRCLLCHGKNL